MLRNDNKQECSDLSINTGIFNVISTEVIDKIVSYLDLIAISLFSQTSKRMNAIAKKNRVKHKLQFIIKDNSENDELDIMELRGTYSTILKKIPAAKINIENILDLESTVLHRYNEHLERNVCCHIFSSRDRPLAMGISCSFIAALSVLSGITLPLLSSLGGYGFLMGCGGAIPTLTGGVGLSLFCNNKIKAVENQIDKARKESKVKVKPASIIMENSHIIKM